MSYRSLTRVIVLLTIAVTYSGYPYGTVSLAHGVENSSRETPFQAWSRTLGIHLAKDPQNLDIHQLEKLEGKLLYAINNLEIALAGISNRAKTQEDRAALKKARTEFDKKQALTQKLLSSISERKTILLALEGSVIQSLDETETVMKSLSGNPACEKPTKSLTHRTQSLSRTSQIPAPEALIKGLLKGSISAREFSRILYFMPLVPLTQFDQYLSQVKKESPQKYDEIKRTLLAFEAMRALSPHETTFLVRKDSPQGMKNASHNLQSTTETLLKELRRGRDEQKSRWLSDKSLLSKYDSLIQQLELQLESGKLAQIRDPSQFLGHYQEFTKTAQQARRVLDQSYEDREKLDGILTTAIRINEGVKQTSFQIGSGLATLKCGGNPQCGIAYTTVMNAFDQSYSHAREAGKVDWEQVGMNALIDVTLGNVTLGVEGVSASVKAQGKKLLTSQQARTFIQKNASKIASHPMGKQAARLLGVALDKTVDQGTEKIVEQLEETAEQLKGNAPKSNGDESEKFDLEIELPDDAPSERAKPKGPIRKSKIRKS